MTKLEADLRIRTFPGLVSELLELVQKEISEFGGWISFVKQQVVLVDTNYESRKSLRHGVVGHLYYIGISPGWLRSVPSRDLNRWSDSVTLTMVINLGFQRHGPSRKETRGGGGRLLLISGHVARRHRRVRDRPLVLGSYHIELHGWSLLRNLVTFMENQEKVNDLNLRFQINPSKSSSLWLS